MYDVRLLRTVSDCRRVMERARAQGNEEVYRSVFRRMCEVSAQDDHSDDLVSDFYGTLAAYEQLLTEKNGRNTPATRTRQKIQNKGVVQSLTEWTMGSKETDGFKLLVDAGLPELTGEYIVVRHGHRFEAKVVERAKQRLLRNGVALP